MAKKQLIGKIVSVKMNKTVLVEIVRKIKHPIYGKIIKRTNKLKADTNNIELGIGQFVKIEQTRPLSKDKNFKVIEIVKKENK